MQRVDVQFVHHLSDHRFDFGSAVTDDVAVGWIERLFAHPANLRVEFLNALRLVVFPRDHIPTGQINVIRQCHRDTLGRIGHVNGLLAHEDFGNRDFIPLGSATISSPTLKTPEAMRPA